MKLKSMTLENFRCYGQPTTLSIDDLTTIVGRNDVGKSALLDALDSFFNDKSLEKSDASKGGNPKAVSITCVFCELPEELLLDEAAPTSLQQEYLLNQDGELEITKVFNCSLEKPKISSIKANAMHPTTAKARDLLTLKISDLKTRAQELGVNMAETNKTIKRDIRIAIRNHIGNLEVAPSEVLLVGDGVDEKGNTPTVFEGIRKALPLYALFKSDRQSSDQDVEAQDPLKIAIKEAIAAQAQQLQEVMTFVEHEVQKVAALTLKKLREMDARVASTLNPKFEKPNWATLIKASITGDDDIPLNKRGSGVRRLILLNFFRAKAERTILEKGAPSAIYAVEEPETSQHPHNQRLLVRALEQLAGGNDQVIITTHTPMLARALPTTSLRFVSEAPDGRRRIDVGGEDAVNDAIAKSLGVLPDHTVRLFIVVEGVNDIAFLKSLCRMFASRGEQVPDLEALELAGQVIFVPSAGAGNLALWAARMEPFRRPEFHLYDRDAPSAAPSKHQAAIDKVNQRLDCKAVCTTRREIENLIPYQAVNACAQQLGLECNLVAPFGPDEDVPKSLAAIFNQTAPQNSRWGDARVKSWLAETVVPAISLPMLAETDQQGEMRGWLHDIEAMLNSAQGAP